MIQLFWKTINTPHDERKNCFRISILTYGLNNLVFATQLSIWKRKQTLRNRLAFVIRYCIRVCICMLLYAKNMPRSRVIIIHHRHSNSTVQEKAMLS